MASTKRIRELIERGAAEAAQPGSLLPALGTAIAVADALKLADEKAWFEAEVAGYAQRGGAVSMLGDVLKVAPGSEIPSRVARYRVVEGTCYIQFGARQPEAFPYPAFLPHPVAQLEDLRQRSGRPFLVVPPEALPEIVHELLRKTNTPPAPMSVYLDPAQFASVLGAIRGELSRFFAQSALLLEDEEPVAAPAQVTTGAISATNVMIVNAAGAAKVVASLNQHLSTTEALASARKEIAEIENHVVGSRKQLDDVKAHAPEIQAALNAVVDRMENRLAGKDAVTPQELGAAAGEAARELAAEKKLAPGVLTSVLQNPLVSGLVTSAIWDGLKAAWPLVEAAAKAVGV